MSGSSSHWLRSIDSTFSPPSKIPPGVRSRSALAKARGSLIELGARATVRLLRSLGKVKRKKNCCSPVMESRWMYSKHGTQLATCSTVECFLNSSRKPLSGSSPSVCSSFLLTLAEYRRLPNSSRKKGRFRRWYMTYALPCGVGAVNSLPR
ncbi:hypothetical protein D9M69_543380 [compost metagenome]